MASKRPAWQRLAGLLCALACLCFVAPLTGSAGAEDAGEQPDVLTIEFSIKPGEMVAPGEATMTFVIENRSEHDVQNVYLSSEDGLLSEPVGQIGAGETQTLVRPHFVTQDELDAGYIAYTISHDPLPPEVEKVSYELRFDIVKGDARPVVDFTRQMSSDRVAPGGLLTVTYRIRNTGNVPVRAVRIRDTLGDFTGRMELLGVGETKSFISRVTLAEAAESSPVLEYAVPSGTVTTLTLDPASIAIAESALDVVFSVGRSVFDTDAADAVLTLTNYGNSGYTNITVTDDVYGGVIADAIALPAGGNPVEVAHTYPLRGASEYRWRVTGVSGAGETLDMTTETVALEGDDAAESVAIALEAVARTPRINRAGTVRFDIAIANTGTVMAREALLYEINHGEIRRLAALPTGEPTRVTAAYDVDEDEQFIFCLNYTDAEGRQRTVTTAPIDVVIAAGGEAPERPESESLELEGQSVKLNTTSTFTVLLIIAGAALAVMLLVLMAASLRFRRDRKVRIAAEKQRIKEEMGKTNPFTPVKQTGRKRRK